MATELTVQSERAFQKVCGYLMAAFFQAMIYYALY
jgi:hypothetical protein